MTECALQNQLLTRAVATCHSTCIHLSQLSLELILIHNPHVRTLDTMIWHFPSNIDSTNDLWFAWFFLVINITFF